jgi:DNA-binding transcriptional MerR regulator
MMPKSADFPTTAVGDLRTRAADDSSQPVAEGRLRHATRSIGQVMAILRTEFPEISISKIRFLEAEGLITPERAPSGYRRYTEGDVERLRYVLSVQREHYLPLKVIREHLEQLDRGQAPLSLSQGSLTHGTPSQGVSSQGVSSQGLSSQGLSSQGLSSQGTQLGGGFSVAGQSANPPAGKQLVRLTRQELLEASGLTETALGELERTQILHTRRGTAHYGRDALTLAIAARRLAEYGIDGRHLRAFKLSADREVGLVEQAIAPYARRTGSNRDVPGDVTQLVISFHAALVRTAMERNISG